MGPWDGTEVDTDGDELLDWLWDFPERYDVGGDDYASAPVATSVTGVRKHLRRPGGAAAPPVRAPAPPSGQYDDRPTLALDPIVSYQDEPEAVGYHRFVGDRGRPRRFTGRDLAAAAAVVLVVAVGAVVGYTMFHRSSKTPRPANLAIATPTTTNPAPSLLPTVDTTPTSVDATTSIPPTSVPTASSVPGAVIGAATSTTRTTPTTRARAKTTTTTTTRTVPPTTTTAPTTTTTSTVTTTTSTSSTTTTSTVASTTSST